MKNPKKTRKILYWVLTIAVIALLLELLWVLSLMKEKENVLSPETTEAAAETTAVPETTEETQAVPETTAPETTAAPVEIEEYAGSEIETPYFTLHYPEELADHLTVVKTADSPFTLEFYAMLEDRPEQRIFDIRLGKNVSGNMGMVKTEQGEIRVDLILYQFVPGDDWSEGEINTVLAMQEAANDMLEQLELIELPQSGNQSVPVETASESSVVNMTVIKTPYCALHYPVRWKDYLVTEQTENQETGVYSVAFYAQVEGREKCLLFTISFGGDEGDQLGAIIRDNGEFVTVNLLVAEPDLTGWPEEDAQIMYSMQEAVNDLIAELPLQ